MDYGVKLENNKIRKDHRVLLYKTDYKEWRSGVEDLALVQNQSCKNLTQGCFKDSRSWRFFDLKSFAKMMIAQKGRYISLRKSQGMFFESFW